MDGNRKIITPFWADADTSGDGGVVWYGESIHPPSLIRAATEIKQAFPNFVPSTFEVTNLFIATWENVGYYNMKKDKVLITNCTSYLARLIVNAVSCFLTL